MIDNHVVAARDISPGTPVEVRTRFLRTWVQGFEAIAISEDHVRLRRRSDGAVLPVAVALADVRTLA